MDATGSQTRHSPWSPFRHRTYAVIWTATVVANIGTWMYSAAAGWLMTTLTADPLMVSLVQVAVSLAMFMFALPAGALADIIDKRHLLIAAETAITILSAVFATLVWMGQITPLTLLLFVFLIEAAAAISTPAWQSIVPTLVPREELSPAVTANSVGMNLSRAVGPALGGIITVVLGVAAPFWVNAVSNLGTLGALWWWRPPQKPAEGLPAERFASGLRGGIRYVRNSPPLRATLRHAVGFFLFASAYWALLPLVARTQIGGGPELYGILLGAIGAGAIGGAFLLPQMKAKLGPDRLIAAGSIGTAGALILYGAAREPITAVAASLIAGMSWIAVLSTLNVSVQFALPEWVRGRGLAIYVTVFFGSMTIGSALWGQIARMVGLPMTHFLAAGGALVAIPLMWRWKLQTAVGIDLAPSMHWPAPVVKETIEHDEGPVLVLVEYRIIEQEREGFLRAMEKLGRERRRDGAYAWDVFEDTSQPGRFIETFLVESWLEHLRQHERVTNADRVLEQQIHRLLQGTPKITHLVSARSATRE